MRKMLVVSVGFLALTVPATAQTVPAELAGTGMDIPFLSMPADAARCTVGVVRLTKAGKGEGCLVSINQCLTQVRGTFEKTYKGDWACKAPRQ